MSRLRLHFLLLVLFLASCDATEVEPEDTDLFIGVALPQTGTLSSAGQAVTRGLNLAIREYANLPGLNVSLIIEDTRSTADGAETAYRKLVGIDNLPAIIGPITSTATEAVIPVIIESGVTSVGPTSAKTGLSAESKYLFRSSLTVGRLIPPGIRTAKQNLGFRNVATLHNTRDAFSVSSHEHIIEELQRHSDVNIAVQASYSRSIGTTLTVADISEQLDNILQASPAVDAIFLSGLPEDQVVILPEAHRRGNDVPFIAPLISILEIQDINELVPNAAEGTVTIQIWLDSSPDQQSQAFVKSYMDNFGMIPDDWAARGYVGTTLLLEALRTSSAYDTDSIHESLSKIKDFQTIFGSFTFNEEGDALYDPIVAVVQDNRFVTWPIVN